MCSPTTFPFWKWATGSRTESRNLTNGRPILGPSTIEKRDAAPDHHHPTARSSTTSGSSKGEQAPRLGDEVVEVSLRAEALPFEHLHNGGDLPHIGDGGFPDGHAVACGEVDPHLPFRYHSRTSFCASTSWSEVIRMASASRSMAPGFPPFAAPSLYHI